MFGNEDNLESISQVPPPLVYNYLKLCQSIKARGLPFPFRRTFLGLQNAISTVGIQQASEVHHDPPFMTGRFFFGMPVQVRFLRTRTVSA